MLHALVQLRTRSDLEQYFEVLGIPEQLGATLRPSLATLYFLANKHVMAIPYQNFDLFAKKDIDLSIEGIKRRLLGQKQGGMCYETSELLFYALETLGFQVKRIPVFPLNNQPFNPDMPSTHNILIVSIEEKHFLVDVGYGYNSLRYPLELRFEPLQEMNMLANEYYQLIRTNEYYQLNLNIKNHWFSLYRFSISLQPIDKQQTDENCRMLLSLPPIVPVRDTYIKIGRLTNDGRIGFHYEPGHLTMLPYKLSIIGIEESRVEYQNAAILKEEIRREIGIEMPDALLREHDPIRAAEPGIAMCAHRP